MRPEQWNALQEVSRSEHTSNTPVVLIIDSPWMPGFVGVSHLDYYFDPEVWFQANLRVMREFPDAIFLPSWWVEYGMAIEPSAVGCRIVFHPDQTPSESPVLFRLEDVSRLDPVNPRSDGFMAMALRQYRTQKQRIFDAGYIVPMVAARGPLCLASFLRGVTDLMMDLIEDPEGAHKLFQFTTQTVIRWLEAQAEVLGDGVEGILVLDDIPGMLSREMYLEFAHPYLKQIAEAFPEDWIKVYHNDANTRPFLEDLPGTGFGVLNWTHKVDVEEAWQGTGGQMCLMGNVPPLDIGVRGTRAQVRHAAKQILDTRQGRPLLLSMGGGVSPGTPADNLRALLEVAAG